MNLYIAGPMSGMPDLNYPLFFETEKRLTELGHNPINPARIDMAEEADAALANAILSISSDAENNRTWEYYMQRDIPLMLKGDGVCLLPNWRRSRGARLEVMIAQTLKMPLYILKDGVLTPRVQVIGISGYTDSGKDIVISHLVEKGWAVASFAERIRSSLYTLNPRVTADSRVSDYVDQYDWDIAKTTSPEIKALLQRLGTEVGRNTIGENVWIDLTLSDIPDGVRVVITDCRFPNEASKVQELGGQVWRVSSPDSRPGNDHISETALDDYGFNAIIHHEGNTEVLRQMLDDLLTSSGYPL